MHLLNYYIGRTSRILILYKYGVKTIKSCNKMTLCLLSLKKYFNLGLFATYLAEQTHVHVYTYISH